MDSENNSPPKPRSGLEVDGPAVTSARTTPLLPGEDYFSALKGSRTLMGDAAGKRHRGNGKLGWSDCFCS